MQTQSINNCSFGAKNTYLMQAKKALIKDDKNKFLSYHYETKARANYLKFLREETELEKLSEEVSLGDLGVKGWCRIIGILSKMAYRKLASGHYIIEAYKLNPKRFGKTVDKI